MTFTPPAHLSDYAHHVASREADARDEASAQMAAAAKAKAANAAALAAGRAEDERNAAMDAAMQRQYRQGAATAPRENPFLARLNQYRQTDDTRAAADAKVHAALAAIREKGKYAGQQRPGYGENKVSEVKAVQRPAAPKQTALDKIAEGVNTLETLRDPASMISPTLSQLGMMAGPAGGAVGGLVGNKIEDTIDPFGAVAAQNPAQLAATTVGDMVGGGVKADVLNGLATGGMAVVNPATLLQDPQVRAEANRVVDDVSQEAGRVWDDGVASLRRPPVRPSFTPPKPLTEGAKGLQRVTDATGRTIIKLGDRVVGSEQVFPDGAKAIFDAAGRLVGQTPAPVKAAAQQVGNTIGSLAGSVGNAVGTAANQVGNAVGTAANQVASAVKKIPRPKW